MVHNPGAFGRAFLTKDERKTRSRDEKKILRKERRKLVKEQERGSRKNFLTALKTAAGLQQKGFVPGADEGAIQTASFEVSADSVVPGVPNWALATGAVAAAAAAVGAVVYFRRRAR